MATSSENAQARLVGEQTQSDAAPDGSGASHTDERRKHVRHPLEVRAGVGLPGGAPVDCRIRDFCVGGLYLALDGANESSALIGGHSLGRGDVVTVSFTADFGTVSQDFAVEVSIARVFPGGMGVAFTGPNPGAVQALRQLAKLASNTRAEQARVRVPEAGDVPAAVIGAAEAGRILAGCKRRICDFFTSTLEALFEQADDDLFVRARDVKSNAEQVELMDATREMGSIKSSVAAAFLDSMRDQLDNLGAPLPAGGSFATDTGSVELQLVDTGTFDDWLAIKEIVDRADSSHAESQFEIEQRLSHLVNVPIDHDNNPVGMSAIGLTFHEAVQNLGMNRAVRDALFGAFETVLVGSLGTLYDDLNRLLSGSGVLPHVERDHHVPKQPRAEPAPDEDDAPEPHAAPDSSESAESSEFTEESAAPATSEEPAPADPAGVTPPPAIVGDALHAARNLLALQRQATLSDTFPAGDVAVASPPPLGAARTQAMDEVIDALSILQRSSKFNAADDTGPLGLRDRLLTTWRAAGLQIADADSDAVEVISNLVDAVLEDPLVSPVVKSRVRRLAIPLVKVALQDGEFFADEAHPARRVINQLGRMEPASNDTQAQESWRKSVDPLIERIVTGYERDPSVFNEVLTDLNSLVARQRQQFAENVSRVVGERKRQQVELDARRTSGADGERAKERPAKGVPTEWQRWLSRVEHLQAGDVVYLDTQGEGARKLTLAWVSDDHGSYLFVDAAGKKAATLTQQELAMHFRRGAARVLDASDLPVVDRGIYRMLNGMHGTLAKKASRDALTGTLNRREFEARVGQALSDAVKMSSTHVLCVLELDELEAIVEKGGRKAGKNLLRKLARVLEKHVRNKGVVGRLGGGRFAMLLNNCDLEHGRAVAERQRKSMEKSRCVWHGETLPLNVSIGVVEIGPESESVGNLIEAADRVFKDAKKAGGNAVRVCETKEAGRDDGSVRLAPGETVTQMLEQGRLQLRCQRVAPIGADETAKPHFEVLLGVKDGDGELGLPRDFIQAAERNNQMQDVDRWVIRTAIEWMAGNRSKVDAAGGYSINLSGLTLGDESLLNYVLDRLTESKVPPAKVVFEVTESAAIDTLSVAVNFIRTLKEYGCRFALDDFGTGDASFSYLKTLPIDYVKIDGHIVRDIVDSPKDFAVVRSINEIGHFLGKKTVAEFVENDEILARLRQIGVDYAQGFGIEAPFVLH